jgi:hypothetical protein
MCATGSRCANAHLLRPAGDENARRLGLFTTAKVARLATADRFAPSLRCDAQPSLIAYQRQIESAPTAPVYGPHATPIPLLSRRSEKPRMKPASNPNQKQNPSPNYAMERSRILVTVRAYARPAPSIRLAHLGR